MTRCRAFTLVELLLASALSVVLMAAVLAVIVQLRQASSADLALPGLGEGYASPEAWVAMLADDLRHAITVEEAGAAELNMVTRSALDAETYEQTHRPVRVRYHIERIGDRSWLIRRQAALDVLDNVHVQRDLVCPDVIRFELVSMGEDPATVPAGGTPPTVAPSESPANDGASLAEPPSGGGSQALNTVRTLDQWLSEMPRDRSSVEYRRYMSAWKKYLEGEKIDFVFNPPPKPKDEEHKDPERAAFTGPAPIPPLPPMPSMYWRLRVWTQGYSEPTLDRPLVLR